MVPLFKNAQSEYFISNYETDAVSAREACEDLGEGFHLLLIENYEELAQLREHVGKRTEGQIEPGKIIKHTRMLDFYFKNYRCR